jgi:hypothetical protein
MPDEFADELPRQALYHPPHHPPVPIPPGMAPASAPTLPVPTVPEGPAPAPRETQYRAPAELPFVPAPRPAPAAPPVPEEAPPPDMPPVPVEHIPPVPDVAIVTEAPAPPTTPAPTTLSFPTSLKDVSTMLKVALGAGGLTLLVAVYLVSGGLVAAAESKSQVDAVQQTGHDLTKIDAFLSNVTVRDASKTDAVAFKAAIDAYAVQLTDTNALLVTDQDRVDATTHNIEFFGWLTPLESAQVHSHDATIGHANVALADVARAVAIFRTETAFESAYVSAVINSDKGVAAAKAKDYTTATSSFQDARNDLSKTQLLVADADVPPQFAPLVEYYSRVMRDLGGLTGAAQANDVVAAIAYLGQLVADSTTLTFDQAGYRAWYSKKIGTIQADFRKHSGHVPHYAPTSTQLV